jgi:uncharacterized protein with PIN domain
LAAWTGGDRPAAADADDQDDAVLRRFVLAGRIAADRRCARCNGRVTPIAKAAIAERLRERIARIAARMAGLVS